MKTKSYIIFSVLFLILSLDCIKILIGKEKDQLSKMVQNDDVQTFKSLMKSLGESAGNELFAIHFQSMIDVIEAQDILTSADSAFIKATLPVFSDPTVAGYAADINSYLDRIRPLTIAWVSPTDGAVSFFRLKLPKDWDQEQTYPLYVDLHGLTSIANNPIEYLTNYYRIAPSETFAFEDGYQLSPWGRGNLWYQGISETDIWECIDVIENLVKIDPSRKYLDGHSMGGYGAWYIASKSADVWAALGIQAGALWYGTDYMLSSEKAQNLSNLPTYIVVGTSDGLYDINLQAYNLLKNAGNQNVEFVTFNGGHEKLPVNVENMYLWMKEFVNEDYTNARNFKNFGENSFGIYPNPIQNETVIHLKLEKPEYVKMTLSDINGKNVATIIEKSLDAGETIIPWCRGELFSGIYMYSILIGQNKLYGKLILY
jgi:predicted esterase